MMNVIGPVIPASQILAELSGFAEYEIAKRLMNHRGTSKGLHYTAAARATSAAVNFGGA